MATATKTTTERLEEWAENGWDPGGIANGDVEMLGEDEDLATEIFLGEMTQAFRVGWCTGIYDGRALGAQR
jgi:hypothetical protein